MKIIFFVSILLSNSIFVFTNKVYGRNKIDDDSGFFEKSKLNKNIDELPIAHNPFPKDFVWNITMVQDIPGYPPYETNGPGPRHKKPQSEMRFKELNFEKPPRPEMPNEEPPQLLQMQEKLSNILGVPSPDYPDVEIEVLSKEINMEEQLARFTEVDESDKSLVRATSKSEEKYVDSSRIHRRWEQATFECAWASSVYTFSWWWWDYSYPASNAIRGWRYWCSTGGHAKSDVITWQGTLRYRRRVSHLWLRWAYGPGEYQIQGSDDMKTWKELKEWKKNKFSNRWWYKLFWWWRWWNRSYTEYVPFNEPVWIKGIRILMRDPVNGYFGLYKVEVWLKQWLVQFINGDTGQKNSDVCLSVQSGHMQNFARVVTKECVDAITPLDTRELFVMQTNLEVTTYRGGKCIELVNGTTADHAELQLIPCSWSLNMGDNREKFTFDAKYHMRAVKSQKRCVTMMAKDLELQGSRFFKASASSTLHDGQHDPYNALDGRDESSWATALGVTTVEYILTFPEQTIKEIIIEWTHAPHRIEVQGLYLGNWRTFIMNDVEGNSTKIQFHLKDLAGIKIFMYGAKDSFKTKEGEKPYIGISEIKVYSGAKDVTLRDCKQEMGGTNKWMLDDVYFTDYTTILKYKRELIKLYKLINKLLDLISILLKTPAQIAKMISKGKTMSAKIKVMEAQIIDIDVRISLFKNQHLKEEVKKRMEKGVCLGASVLKPGRNCKVIKRSFPYKSTGYYWIKPDCAKSALRVFCDFTTDRYGIDYAYFGSTSSHIHSKIDSHEHALLACARLGLQYIELKNQYQIDMISKYLEDIGLDLGEKGVIPIGYDWGCDEGRCSNRYKSLNLKASNDMSDAFRKRLDKTSIFNQIWARVFNKPLEDVVAFGMSHNGLVRYRLGNENIPVKGVICSTNFYDTGEAPEFVTLDCDTDVRGSEAFHGTLFTNIKATCPPGCLNKGKTQVWGSKIYKDDSSICKAAIHAGIIKADLGGNIEVGISRGIDESEVFKGSEENGIQTLDYNEKWDRTFVVNKPEVFCPIDKFQGEGEDKKSDTTSFLELNQNITIRKTKLANSFLEESTRILSDETLEERDAIESNMFSFEEKNNTKNDNENDDGDNEKGGGNKKDEIDEKKDSEDRDDTQKAFEKVEKHYDIDKEDLRKQIKVVQDEIALRLKIEGQLGPLLNSDINPKFQMKRLDVLNKHILGTFIEIDMCLGLAFAKLKEKQHQLKKMQLELMKLKQFEDYQETYLYFTFDDLYETQKMKKASGKPKWNFTKDNVGEGHSNAIADTSGCQLYNGNRIGNFATFAILRYRTYYDGVFKVSFMARDDQEFGIGFRYIDQWNYYAFVLKKAGNGYKRIIKVVGGKPEILVETEDGGYNEGVWYDVVITIAGNSFKVQMGLESSSSNSNTNQDEDQQDSYLPEIFTGKDMDISNGNFAFMHNGMKGIFFDKFKLRSTICIPPDSPSKINFIPPKCSRFKENGLGDFIDNWEYYDDYNSINGPSDWKGMRHNGKGMIAQRSDIYSTGPDQVPAIYGLKLNKLFEESTLITSFNAKSDKGFVGIGFHYKNYKNFYTWEVFGEAAPQCRFRQIIGGRFSTAETGTNCGYLSGSWTKIVIRQKQGMLYIFQNIGGLDDLKEVLKVKVDNQLNKGSIALSTFQTQAVFTDIQMMCNDDYDQMMQEEGKGPGVQSPLPRKQTKQGGKKQAGNGGSGYGNGNGSGSGAGGTEGGSGGSVEDAGFAGGNGGGTGNGGFGSGGLGPGGFNGFDMGGNSNFGEMSGCIQKKHKSERDSWCNDRFIGDYAAQEYCSEDFCLFCCKTMTNPIVKIQQNLCEKQCNSLSQPIEKPSDNMYWNLCIESPNPNTSIYDYCHNKMDDLSHRLICKVDFCNVCCAMTDGIFNDKFNDVIIKKCHKGCTDRYALGMDVNWSILDKMM